MRTLLVVLAGVALILSLGTAVTQADTVTPTDDTTIVHARTTPPYGLDPVLIISNNAGVAEHRTFLNFDVGALFPPGTLLNKALLRIYVNNVTQAGDINVLRVTSAAWNEATLTWVNQPTGVLYTVVPVDASDVNHYVTVDVTPVVQGWLNGTFPNYGFALVGGSQPVNASLDSKENGNTSHQPELEIVPVGPQPAGPSVCVSTAAAQGQTKAVVAVRNGKVFGQTVNEATIPPTPTPLTDFTSAFGAITVACASVTIQGNANVFATVRTDTNQLLEIGCTLNNFPTSCGGTVTNLGVIPQ